VLEVANRRGVEKSDSLGSASFGAMTLERLHHWPTLHGEVVFQVAISFVAQAVGLSLWHDVHAFGILYLSVIAGVMNLKVCDLTNEPGTPCVSIFGIWHAMH
jgi:hypothetical protein